MAAYSRICETGFEIFAPNQFSTVTWCETPSPSTIRPPENSSIVAAACAIVDGRAREDRHDAGTQRARSLTEA